MGKEKWDEKKQSKGACLEEYRALARYIKVPKDMIRQKLLLM